MQWLKNAHMDLSWRRIRTIPMGVVKDVGLEDFWSIQTWLLAIVGSIVVLVIYGFLTGRKS